MIIKRNNTQIDLENKTLKRTVGQKSDEEVISGQNTQEIKKILSRELITNLSKIKNIKSRFYKDNSSELREEYKSLKNINKKIIRFLIQEGLYKDSKA